MPSAATTLRTWRLGHCAICERPFAIAVSDTQARADWGDAADDEIGYACGACADDEGLTEA